MTEQKKDQNEEQNEEQKQEQGQKKEESKKESKNEKRSTTEEFKIAGAELVDKIKELIREGNIRRVIIKNEEGKVLIEVPLTLGLVGGAASIAFMPVLAAVGAIAALVTKLTVVVEKEEE